MQYLRKTKKQDNMYTTCGDTNFNNSMAQVNEEGSVTVVMQDLVSVSKSDGSEPFMVPNTVGSNASLLHPTHTEPSSSKL